MEINLVKLSAKIQPVNSANKHENLLANASISLSGEFGEYLTITGFSIWRSKFGGFNVEVPTKWKFKYCLIEKSFWEKIKKEILKEYEYFEIPVLQEKAGESR